MEKTTNYQSTPNLEIPKFLQEREDAIDRAKTDSIRRQNHQERTHANTIERLKNDKDLQKKAGAIAVASILGLAGIAYSAHKQNANYEKTTKQLEQESQQYDDLRSEIDEEKRLENLEAAEERQNFEQDLETATYQFGDLYNNELVEKNE